MAKIVRINETETRAKTDEIRSAFDGIKAVVRQATSKDVLISIPIEELEKLTIKNDLGKMSRFRLNDSQKKILEKINWMVAKGLPVRQQLLKLRQFGGSTFYTAVLYYLVREYGLNAVIIGHKDSASSNLYQMVLRYYNNDPKFKAHKAHGRMNDNILRLHGGGEIRVHTAGAKDTATSQTNQVILATEQALWPGNPREQMRSLLNTVKDKEGTFVFIESTARGIGNDYHSRWMTATRDWETYKREKRTPLKGIMYLPVFIGWLQHPECVKHFKGPEHREAFIESIGAYHETKEDNELELAYIDLGASPERLFWWRTTLASKCNGVIPDMQQENPATPDEAFLSTGNKLFDPNRINKAYNAAKRPLWKGEMNYDASGLAWAKIAIDESERKKVFQEIELGRMKVWEWPERKLNYAIGCDVAEGISVVKRGREQNDDSAVVVRNRETGVIAATWCGKIKPEEFAVLVRHIGLIWNKAVVCIEANNMGHTTNSELWRIYPKHLIYRQTQNFNTRKERTGERIGYFNTITAKPFLMNQVSASFRWGELKIHDKVLLMEMTEVEIDQSTGRIETKGKDLVMALALQEEAHSRMSMRKFKSDEADAWQNYKKDKLERYRVANEQAEAAWMMSGR